MRSALPKVLHEIAGRPMLGHILAASVEAGASRLCLVTAPGQQEVRDYALTQVPEISNCIQKDQLGTGDAVRAAMSDLGGVARVVIMFGDTPLLRPDMLRELATFEAD
ncbi:MAG: NTP transferase domain-containing protein, partial [Pseudomonadota bacterium]|nr:NTP transferase domain-containing protein [Pseudomonadota bacterium]